MSKVWQIVLLVAVVVVIWFLLTGDKEGKMDKMNDSSAYMQEENVTPSSSASDVMTSIYADAEVDASNASTESEEDTYMNSQVDGFTSVRDTQYENNF